MASPPSIKSPDRSRIFPPHEGQNVLPNSPFFTKLLRHAHRGRLAIRDHLLGVEKTYLDLLGDALSLRSALEKRLDPSVVRRLRRGDELYIGVLAAGGYEFAVAMVAALAIGAAVVPMSVANPPEEVVYFVNKSRQIAILSSSSTTGLAQSVLSLRREQGQPLAHLTVSDAMTSSSRLQPRDIVISCDRYLDDNTAGVVIFTSGTTGKPKGSVLRRAYIHEAALNVVEGYDITHKDVLLHTLPVHHATGLGTSFFPWMVSGACIEFKTHGSFDPAWVWRRIREGGITVFSGVPTMYLRLMWHYNKELANLPDAKKDAYTAGVRALRCLLCGSSALQQPVQNFWTSLRDNGKPGIFVRYGSSEVPGCIRVSADADFPRLPGNSVGSPTAGVDVKINSERELLIKSPLMFSGYLLDEAATVAAHDELGWFKTGDIARQEGPYIFIVGRASVDIIKSGGYKIGAPEVEQACLKLPNVREVSVLGVDDEEFGQRVAAVVLPTAGSNGSSLRIDRLREDLRQTLPAYKLPTLLRVVDGELPKGETGKVQKKILGPQLFPSSWQEDSRVQVWRSTKARL
ncbi:uncharacterized protein LTR77_003622 [Saxophila tyrrhenica]|uniref:Malonate--CoA ligase n=1 Tax=Saxophila tyrrhenica TaxID=1690608 RepID=A0AAV9PEU6_9PEZI|nr:hypothetical protein LTR77_003622 [Saxophila tyrrhenica]